MAGRGSAEEAESSGGTLGHERVGEGARGLPAGERRSLGDREVMEAKSGTRKEQLWDVIGERESEKG